MKVAILAGGLGTRLSEETVVKPKPMVEIAGRPILWHIMKLFACQGYREFVIALGYKGEVIKDYFLHYHQRFSNLTLSLSSGEAHIHPSKNGHEAEDWCIHLIDTGLNTQTGGRVKRVAEFIGNEPFILTYGDGLANINIASLVAFHNHNKKLATVTAVHPPARFGEIAFDGNQVVSFNEKPQTTAGWINGGFFVLEPEAAGYIKGDETIFERDPMEGLSRDGQLVGFRHEGFWQCMDTLRDVRLLEELWQTGKAPWRIW